MSKLIYGEALEIVAAALDLPDRSVTFKHTALNVIKKALEQAQKQEKLLELYRELNNKILHTYDIFGRMTNKEWKKFADIQQQIKELENDK